jgi:hypothetical protein
MRNRRASNNFCQVTKKNGKVKKMTPLIVKPLFGFIVHGTLQLGSGGLGLHVKLEI